MLNKKVEDLTMEDIGSMMDCSAVQAQSTLEDARNVILYADRYNTSGMFLLGGNYEIVMPEVKEMNARRAAEGKRCIKVGGTVGFPDGGHPTSVKVYEVERMMELGCDELDCVIQVGLAISGEWKRVEEDLAAIRRASEGIVLKTIIETPYLTPEQITTASKIAMNVGSDWVKTSTGWPSSKKTTVEDVILMKAAVGDNCGIKAAGGIRNIETLKAMYAEGARLFGLSWTSVKSIMEGGESQNAQY
ncbi:MAG: deoxyribose-phosphate aldolase [Thermoguttaceae bacterium]|nr:deoxyribose-phosphate aldolase [Thermoguttaceae bacterium]MBP3693949.1 deoxyribose-phosphate aldolase [Thermoguttaceae bacterium]MBQ2820822.1 deoxyribose-phosphate aldolase [Thermoguttaceae bacterium]